MWKGFLDTLIARLRGHSVLALETPARIVFGRYFESQAPFEQRGRKEFPDAFVVEGLSRYCTSNDISMYVVSGDAALRRAAEGHACLVPLQTLDEVLAAATASTVMRADYIAVLDGGWIVERGTHAQLLRSGGLYAQLWTKQGEASGWSIS